MKRKIIVFPEEQSENKRPPRNLLKFSEWLQYIIQEIPVDYQGVATIDAVTKVSESSQLYAAMEIAFWREETDMEEKQRLRQAEADDKLLVEKELAELKRLKAKYEG